MNSREACLLHRTTMTTLELFDSYMVDTCGNVTAAALLTLADVLHREPEDSSTPDGTEAA